MIPALTPALPLALVPQVPEWSTLRLVMPEIWLVITMAAILLAPLFGRREAASLCLVTAAGLLMALLWAALSITHLPADSASLFHASLSIDPFSQFFKILLTGFSLLVVLQWWLTGRERVAGVDLPDFLCLLVGATFGMALMASAANLLTIVIATEAASLPSFALAAFRKKERIGAEAGLKYVLFGSVASAIMIYGLSLVYGTAGSLDLATAGTVLAEGVSPMMAVGLLGLLVGVAFKLSAVPLHFWCPDVFEGAPIEVTTFLSVASKGAAICLLLRILQVFGAAGVAAGDPLLPLAVAVAILGGITATWGNLVAFHQENIKRLLAYSSIAHAGYMIMAASAVIFAHAPGTQLVAEDVASAILFYLLVYLFMNLGAFTVAAVMARHEGTESIRDYAGLLTRSPTLAVLLMLFLLSLFGMPGLGGFLAKVSLMSAMAGIGTGGILLVAVLLLNTLLSLYYYLKPIYYMAFQADPTGRPALVPGPAVLALLIFCAGVLLLTGLWPAAAGNLAADHGVMLHPAILEGPAAQAAQTAAAAAGGG